MRILVVDDDCGIVELFKEIFRDFEVIGTCSGREGIELYKKCRPDIVLMDIKMPEVSGFEATKEILKIDPDAVVIVVTAYRREFEKVMRSIGAKEVIEKPFPLKEIRECVMKYSRGKCGS